MSSNLPEPTAFVFSAGGAQAAAQLGMMSALLEHGWQPDLVVGTSFGAINATAFAANPGDWQRVREELSEFWTKVGSDSPFSSLGTSAVKQLTTRKNHQEKGPWRDLLDSVIPTGELKELELPTTLVATDLAAARSRPLTQGETRQAVFAASAVPLVISPATISGTLLCDGSFTEAVPILRALTAGAAAIVALDTGPSMIPTDEIADLKWWEVGTAAYTHMMRGQLGPDLVAAAKEVPVISISSDAGTVFDFSQPTELIEAGREVAEDLLSELPRRISKPGIYGVPRGYEDYAPIQALINS